MSNPFTLAYGRKPKQFIDRAKLTDEIVSDFTVPEPSNNAFMLTGVRGSGKSVMLSALTQIFAKEKDWIAIDLNPKSDMLESLASQLYEHPTLRDIFVSANVNFSLPFVGVSISKKEEPKPPVEIAIKRMLETAKKHNKRIFIAIDEVANTQYMREFAAAFQILIRNDLPVYTVMTGLFNNIDNLQNNKDLTFLYRTPRYILGALNMNMIASTYKEIFNISNDEARLMASLTKGYGYAFQVLGYLTWENLKLDKSVIKKFDTYMAEYSYEKIWSELAKKEQQIMTIFAEAGDKSLKTKDILEKASLTYGEFSVYRDRLIKKGVLAKGDYGFTQMALPRFDIFVKHQASFDLEKIMQELRPKEEPHPDISEPSM